MTLFNVPAETVVDGVACTWCAAEVGEDCCDYKWMVRQPAPHPHAQRWRDYWNATHERHEQTPVYPAPWLATA